MSLFSLRTAGLVLAGTGVLHFATPGAFEPISKLAFPQDTRRWIYRNGATEVALGAALAAGGKARAAGLVGAVVYTGWLAARARSTARSAV